MPGGAGARHVCLCRFQRPPTQRWGLLGPNILWVATASAEVRRPVTLVSTPMFVQHHPWPQHSRPLTNASIVLHGLKSKRSETYREQAIAQASGPFEPLQRRCGRALVFGSDSADVLAYAFRSDSVVWMCSPLDATPRFD